MKINQYDHWLQHNFCRYREFATAVITTNIMTTTCMSIEDEIQITTLTMSFIAHFISFFNQIISISKSEGQAHFQATSTIM